jgi:hypothetical protein
MTTTPTNSRGRIIAAQGVLALVAAAAVWFGVRAITEGPDTEPPRQAASTSDSRTVAPTSAPPDGVVLPSGARQVDGHPVAFPHTDLGAAAAQAGVAEAQVGFDYDEAVAVAGLYAAAEDKPIFEARARAAVALRRQQAGVPRHGAVPPPASYAATPIAFTLEKLDTDYYAVNLLSYITLTTTASEVRDGLYAGTQLVRWVDGDWKLVQGTGEDLQRLIDEGQPQAAAPGTPEYQQAGWITINGAAR